MKLNEQDILQLEAYWKDQLGEAARKDLEIRLAADDVFRLAAADWQNIVQQGFSPTKAETTNRQELLRQLHEIEANLSEAEKAIGTISIRPLWLIVGTLAAGIALLLLFNLLRPKSELDALLSHLSMEKTYSAETYASGAEAYAARDYQAAYSMLLQEIQHPDDSLNVLYAGVAALHLDEAEKAIPLLRYIVETEDWQAYHEDGRWYLALAYAQAGEKGKARELVEEMIEKGDAGAYYNKAIKLELWLNEPD